MVCHEGVVQTTPFLDQFVPTTKNNSTNTLSPLTSSPFNDGTLTTGGTPMDNRTIVPEDLNRSTGVGGSTTFVPRNNSDPEDTQTRTTAKVSFEVEFTSTEHVLWTFGASSTVPPKQIDRGRVTKPSSSKRLVYDTTEDGGTQRREVNETVIEQNVTLLQSGHNTKETQITEPNKVISTSVHEDADLDRVSFKDEDILNIQTNQQSKDDVASLEIGVTDQYSSMWDQDQTKDLTLSPNGNHEVHVVVENTTEHRDWGEINLKHDDILDVSLNDSAEDFDYAESHTDNIVLENLKTNFTNRKPRKYTEDVELEGTKLAVIDGNGADVSSDFEGNNEANVTRGQRELHGDDDFTGYLNFTRVTGDDVFQDVSENEENVENPDNLIKFTTTSGFPTGFSPSSSHENHSHEQDLQSIETSIDDDLRRAHVADELITVQDSNVITKDVVDNGNFQSGDINVLSDETESSGDHLLHIDPGDHEDDKKTSDGVTKKPLIDSR